MALTRILASPQWRALAAVGHPTFVNEMRRTVSPNYVWDPVPYWRYVEPLARMFREEQKHQELLARHPEFQHFLRSPAPVPETIESERVAS